MGVAGGVGRTVTVLMEMGRTGGGRDVESGRVFGLELYISAVL